MVLELENMCIKELKKEKEELEDLIYGTGCYSVRDLKILSMINREIERRQEWTYMKTLNVDNVALRGL